MNFISLPDNARLKAKHPDMTKRILLTGSNGMVGKNILEHPLAKQVEFLTPAKQSLNLTDYHSVLDYLKTQQPDLIIHSAGLVGGIHANIASPVNFLIQNMEMGKNIVLAAREAGIKQMINLGSSCMYPRNCKDSLPEEMILTGELEPTNEGYALAKIMVLRLCQYIFRENPEYHYKTLIPCNLYGRFDKFAPKHSHLIPAIIHKIHLAKTNSLPTVEIWGNGEARREFMCASDLADIVMKSVSDYDQMPAILNAGLGYDYSINEYYQIAANIVGWQGEFVHDLTKPVGMQRKLLNIDKLSAFGWQARSTLEQGIARAYAYYLESGVSHELSVG